MRSVATLPLRFEICHPERNVVESMDPLHLYIDVKGFYE